MQKKFAPTQDTRERYEAFWRGEIADRPLVQVTAPRAGAVRAPAPRNVEDFLDPDTALGRMEQDVAATCYAGDAFPLVFPVSPRLVAIQAAYLGGAYNIESGTAWCEPTISDWDTRPPLSVDPDNVWWRRSQRIIEQGARRFDGRIAVGIPDLQGGGQILDLLRGTAELAMDLIEHPDEVRKALEEVDETWLRYWQTCNDLILPHQDGYVDWLRVWSDRPAVTVECDLCCMISPTMFSEFFLPSLRRQTEWIERTIYHLDGEGAIRHLDALLELESLDGIQWVPGAGAKPMIEWVPLLKRIRERGKLVVAKCRPEEVMPILEALRPEGVRLGTGCATPDAADALVEAVAARF